MWVKNWRCRDITFTTQRISNRETMGSVNSTFCENVFEESYLQNRYTIRIVAQSEIKCWNVLNYLLSPKFKLLGNSEFNHLNIILTLSVII